MANTPTPAPAPQQSVWKREAWGVFWTILFIVFLRVYILEPYVIPSESMVPSLLVGDHVFVARGAYDFKLPFTNLSLLKVSDPFRGDVIVFDYPIENSPNAGKFFVKRVIGLPGDSVEVHGGVPYINGKAFVQTPVDDKDVKADIKGFKLEDHAQILREEIPNAREQNHWVQRTPPRNYYSLEEAVEAAKASTGRSCINIGEQNADGQLVNEFSGYLMNEVCPAVVPANHYFVMGDNRDNSSDGRVFGFVDRSIIKGRVLFIWFSPPPGEENPYTSGPAILAALKDMPFGLIRMLKDPGRMSRVGDAIR